MSEADCWASLWFECIKMFNSFPDNLAERTPTKQLDPSYARQNVARPLQVGHFSVTTINRK